MNLNLLEEWRSETNLRNVRYKQMSEKYLNSKVKIRKFKEGDLVLKKVLGISMGTFGPTREGPLRIFACLSNGAYELEDLDGFSAQYPWNVVHLKKYHQHSEFVTVVSVNFWNK